MPKLNGPRGLERRQFLTELGFRLRRRRLERGLTQAQLGALAGCNSGSIGNLEVGRYGLALHSLMQLCRVLKISADELLGLETPPQHCRQTGEAA